ncbi:hypothetical protein FYZ39_00775, partial [Mobiluncus curtisii]
IQYLIDLVKHGMAETTASWRLMPDQQWVRVNRNDAGLRLEDIQETLMSHTSSRVAGRGGVSRH